jgi:hypothetical protein
METRSITMSKRRRTLLIGLFCLICIAFVAALLIKVVNERTSLHTIQDFFPNKDENGLCLTMRFRIEKEPSERLLLVARTNVKANNPEAKQHGILLLFEYDKNKNQSFIFNDNIATSNNFFEEKRTIPLHAEKMNIFFFPFDSIVYKASILAPKELSGNFVRLYNEIDNFYWKSQELSLRENPIHVNIRFQAVRGAFYWLSFFAVVLACLFSTCHILFILKDVRQSVGLYGVGLLAAFFALGRIVKYQLNLPIGMTEYMLILFFLVLAFGIIVKVLRQKVKDQSSTAWDRPL